MRDFSPPRELRQLPFGPLLREWTKRGYGLPPAKKGARKWSDDLLIREMLAIQDGALLSKDWGSDSTIRKYKNGGSFPEDNTWIALREALTKHFDDKVRIEWNDLITRAWKACCHLNPDERKKLYRRATGISPNSVFAREPTSAREQVPDAQPEQIDEYEIDGDVDTEEKAVDTAQALSLRSSVLAMPFDPESEHRKPWPENLLMRIGVDRTKLLAVVTGVEGAAMVEALRSAEACVVGADQQGLFGRRQWMLVDQDRWPTRDECEPVGVVWALPEDLTADYMTEAVRSCWPSTGTAGNQQMPDAGSILVAIVDETNKTRPELLLRQFRERTDDLAQPVDVCGWSVTQADALFRNIADQTVSAPPSEAGFLTDFQWEILQTCVSSQWMSRRYQALEELRRKSPEMPLKWRMLIDWVIDKKILDADFLAQTDVEVCQIAGMAGLLTGSGSAPTEIQAERGAAVVRAVSQNPDLAPMLLSLPVCVPVLQTLVEGEATLRAILGLVTAEELGRAVKPWVGRPMDQWRQGRSLAF